MSKWLSRLAEIKDASKTVLTKPTVPTEPSFVSYDTCQFKVENELSIYLSRDSKAPENRHALDRQLPELTKVTPAGDLDNDTEAGGTPEEQLAEWRAGIELLFPSRPPEGFPRSRWPDICRASARLVQSPWGERLAELGWSTLDIFGIDRHAPNAYQASKGLVHFLPGNTLALIEVHAAHIRHPNGVVQTYHRDHLDRTRAVALWAPRDAAGEVH
jgi:hypothetical protein